MDICKKLVLIGLLFSGNVFADMVGTGDMDCNEEKGVFEQFSNKVVDEELCRDRLYADGPGEGKTTDDYCTCLQKRAKLKISKQEIDWLQSGFDKIISENDNTNRNRAVESLPEIIEKFLIEQTMDQFGHSITQFGGSCDAKAFSSIPAELKRTGSCSSAQFNELTRRFVDLGLASGVEATEHERMNATRNPKLKESFFTHQMKRQVSALAGSGQGNILGVVEGLIFEGLEEADDKTMIDSLNRTFEGHSLFKNYQIKLFKKKDSNGQEIRTLSLDSSEYKTSIKLYQGPKVSMFAEDPTTGDGDYVENITNIILNEVISKLPEVEKAMKDNQSSCAKFKNALKQFCSPVDREQEYLTILSDPGFYLTQVKDKNKMALTTDDVNLIGALQCYAISPIFNSYFTNDALQAVKDSPDFSRRMEEFAAFEALDENMFDLTLSSYLSETNEEAQARNEETQKAKEEQIEKRRQTSRDKYEKIATMSGVGSVVKRSSGIGSKYIQDNFNKSSPEMREMIMSQSPTTQETATVAPQEAVAVQPQVTASSTPGYSFVNSLVRTKKDTSKDNSLSEESAPRDYRDDMIASMQRRLDRMMGIDKDSDSDSEETESKVKKSSSQYKTQKDIKALKEELQRLREEKEEAPATTTAAVTPRTPARTQAPVFSPKSGTSNYSSDNRQQQAQSAAPTQSSGSSSVGSQSSAPSTAASSSGGSSSTSSGSKSKAASAGGSAGGAKGGGLVGGPGLQFSDDSAGDQDNRIVISADDFKSQDQNYAAKLFAESNGKPIYVTKKDKNGKEVVLVYQAVKTKSGKVKLVAVKKIKDKKKIKNIRARKRMTVEELNRKLKSGLGEKR